MTMRTGLVFKTSKLKKTAYPQVCPELSPAEEVGAFFTEAQVSSPRNQGSKGSENNSAPCLHASGFCIVEAKASAIHTN